MRRLTAANAGTLQAVQCGRRVSSYCNELENNIRVNRQEENISDGQPEDTGFPSTRLNIASIALQDFGLGHFPKPPTKIFI